MLCDFFRINLPYGFVRNENNEWMAFNREYMPLGFNNLKYREPISSGYLDYPVHTPYRRIDDQMLMELIDDDGSIVKDDTGKIKIIYLYNDSTNPINSSLRNLKLWDKYFNKLRILSRLRAF